MINTRTDDLAVVKDLGLKVKKAVNKRYRLLELELDGIFKTMCVTQRPHVASMASSWSRERQRVSHAGSSSRRRNTPR